MSDFFSSSTVVLAYSLHMSRANGIYLLIAMTLFVFGPLLFRKTVEMPKGLWVSSIIPYVLVLINILEFLFKLQVPGVIGDFCFAAVLYPNSLANGAFGMGAGFFAAPFIIETLCIFVIVRVILHIKHKFSAKKPQIKQAESNNSILSYRGML
jgi:uncharacterized membrane protein